MGERVRVTPMAEVVTFVNDWATQPRTVGRRALERTGVEAEELVAAADRLFAVFAAAGPAQRATAVDVLLAETEVRPALNATADGLVADWVVPDRRRATPAGAALALRAHLAVHPDRIGVCGDRRCADVYVDSSPAGHRRFCSLTCQNRSRTEAWRRRRRAGA